MFFSVFVQQYGSTWQFSCGHRDLIFRFWTESGAILERFDQQWNACKFMQQQEHVYVFHWNVIESNRETSKYSRGCQKAIFPWSYAAIKSVLVHDLLYWRHAAEQVSQRPDMLCRCITLWLPSATITESWRLCKIYPNPHFIKRIHAFAHMAC